MKKLTLLFFAFYGWITYGQTFDDYDFEITLKMNIENTGSCYAHTTFVESDSVKVSYYFISEHFNYAKLKKTEDGAITISGNFTNLVGMLQLQPILVIMVEPVYGKKKDCNNNINTYFVDFNNVVFDRTKASFVIGLQTLNLNDQKFIRLLGSASQPKIEYSTFIFTEMLQLLKFNVPSWYRIE